MFYNVYSVRSREELVVTVLHERVYGDDWIDAAQKCQHIPGHSVLTEEHEVYQVGDTIVFEPVCS